MSYLQHVTLTTGHQRRSSLSEDEFRSAVAETKLSDRTRQAAHRVLVNGWTRRAAGESAGRTTQWASQAAARVVEAHRGLIGCPAGWEIVGDCAL